LIERKAKNGATTMLDMTMKTKYFTAKKGQDTLCVCMCAKECVFKRTRNRQRNRDRV
jgi:hypothetical protein